MKLRSGLVAVVVAVAISACGSSSKTSTGSSVAAVNSTTSSTSSTTSTTNAPAAKKKKQQAAAKPKKKHSATQTTTTSTTTTSPTTTSSTTTTTTSTTPHTTTTHTTPALAPLPSPYVSGSSGQMRAQLHGENHTPKIGRGWAYEVEATNAKGQPLTGTVAAQFLFNGTVVGHQSPPSFPLKNGRMSYGRDTFPPASKGIPLTFEVVVTTPLGTIKLDWPVKSHL